MFGVATGRTVADAPQQVWQENRRRFGERSASNLPHNRRTASGQYRGCPTGGQSLTRPFSAIWRYFGVSTGKLDNTVQNAYDDRLCNSVVMHVTEYAPNDGKVYAQYLDSVA